jgi:hypothetical protein
MVYASKFSFFCQNRDIPHPNSRKLAITFAHIPHIALRNLYVPSFGYAKVFDSCATRMPPM